MLERILALIGVRDVPMFLHGYEELARDGICVGDILEGRPIHVVWGVPRGFSSPAVLVTAYRPDPMRWDDEFKTRKR